MERLTTVLLGKEHAQTRGIRFVDNWNGPDQGLPLTIDVERMTDFAVRDFNFTKAEIERTTVIVDDMFKDNDQFNPVLGALTIYGLAHPAPESPYPHHVRHGLVSNAVEELAWFRAHNPTLIPKGMPVEMIAAHALREGLAVKKAYLNQLSALDRKTDKATLAMAGTIAVGLGGILLMKNGIDPYSLTASAAGTLGLGRRTIKLMQEEQSLAVIDKVGLYKQARELVMKTSKEENREEIYRDWASIFNSGEA